jgi:hypothetical protein
MIVYKLTLAQKKKLVGVEFVTDCVYNPSLDADGNWYISQEEIDQTTDENFLWVKDLPQIEYNPILYKN